MRAALAILFLAVCATAQPVPSVVDTQGMGSNTVKVSIRPQSLDAEKVGVAVVNSQPFLTEMYLENQDGHGNRLGSTTLGVDWNGNGFIGSSSKFSVIDTGSQEPHTELLTADAKTGMVTIPVLRVGRLIVGTNTFPELPTIPPVTKPASKFKPVTQGAGAAMLINKRAAVVSAQRLWLAWDYTEDKANVVFNVRQCKTNTFAVPSKAWPVVATVPTLNWGPFTPDKTCRACWFTVTASNTATRLESGFSTR